MPGRGRAGTGRIRHMAKRKKRKKKLKLLAAFLILVAAGYGFWRFQMAPGSAENPVVPVSLKKGAIVDRLTETGKVEHETVVEVKSAISGRVKTLTVDEGQEVKENQVMAIISPDPDQALRLSEKAVSVKKFRILWKQAEKEYERLTELYQKDLISKEQQEDAEDQRDLAKHSYDLASLELRILQEEVKSISPEPVEENPASEAEADSNIELQDFKVLAPVAGLVIQKKVEEGEMVIQGTSSFTQGTTLFRIGDPRKIIVSALINEIDVAKLSPGMPVKIIPNAGPQRTYRGEIEKISPEGVTVENIVYFRVEVLVINADSFLRQGMTCDVDIVLGEKEDAFYLPVEAVLKVYKKDKEGKETKQVDKYMVFKKSATGYEKVEVQVGIRSETRMEILGGLMPEDKVHPDAEKIHKEQKKEEEERARTLKKAGRRLFHGRR